MILDLLTEASQATNGAAIAKTMWNPKPAGFMLTANVELLENQKITGIGAKDSRGGKTGYTRRTDMSRTKGYKCYNIQCGSCIGKTLCGESEDAALSCQDRVVDSGTAVDYEKLASSVKLCGSTPKVDQCRKCPYWADGDMSKCIPRMTADCFTAITDLLARAEAAEEELKQKETYYNQMVDALAATDSFEKQKLCEEADHLKDLLKEAEALAEKAERERDAAVKQLHGKCSACKHYSAYHQKGKCKNCCWDNANPACLREYQEDNWEWKGTEE